MSKKFIALSVTLVIGLHSLAIQPVAGALAQTAEKTYSLNMDNVCVINKDLESIVECVGRNYYLGTATKIPQAKVPTQLKSVLQIGVGINGNACALETSGQITCWGSDNVLSAIPSNRGPFTSISVGDQSACAINSSEDVYCWGRNLGVSESLGSYSKVFVGGSNVCAIDTSSSLRCWEQDYSTYGISNVPGNLGNVKDLAINSVAACAQSDSGLISCWGWNYSGILVPPSNLGIVSSLLADKLGFCAHLANGSVRCWGPVDNWDNFFKNLGLVKSLGISSDANGRLLACGVREDGTLTCSGATMPAAYCGSLKPYSPIVTGLRKVGEPLTVSANSTDGASYKYEWFNKTSLVGTGASYTPSGRDYLVDLSLRVTRTRPCYKETISTVSVPINTIGERNFDLTLGISGNPRFGQTLTAAITNSPDPSGLGKWWSIAWLRNGTQVSEGLVRGLVQGQDVGSVYSYRVTVREAGYKDFVRTSAKVLIGGELSSSQSDTCVVISDGQVRCWGKGGGSVPEYSGQAAAVSLIGNKCVMNASAFQSCGDLQQPTTPVHNCFLNSSGTVQCASLANDPHKSAVVPGNMGEAIQLSLGKTHTCALLENREVKCWGSNIYGESTPPSDVVDVKTISSGDGFTCALLRSQAVKCWGRNDTGQTTVPDLSIYLVPKAPRQVQLNRPDSDSLLLSFAHDSMKSDGDIIWTIKNLNTGETECTNTDFERECRVEGLVVGQTYKFSVQGQNPAGSTQIATSESYKFCPIDSPYISVSASRLVVTGSTQSIRGEYKNLCEGSPKLVDFRTRESGANWTKWTRIPVDSKGKFTTKTKVRFNTAYEFKGITAGKATVVGSGSFAARIKKALPLSFSWSATKTRQGFTQGGNVTIKFSGDSTYSGLCVVYGKTDLAYNFALTYVGAESKYSSFKVSNGYGQGKLQMAWNGRSNVSALCSSSKFQDIFDFRLPVFKANF